MVKQLIHTRDEIFKLLDDICDPEIPVVSVHEMGILRDVKLYEDTCEVIITPTYSGCPAMDIIEQDIIALLKKNGIPNIKVTTIYSPAWTTDWMSDSTKEKLRKFGIAAPLHSSCSSWLKSSQENVHCPLCNSTHTKLISQFGSTACKALYRCEDCLEPFDYFKCH